MAHILPIVSHESKVVLPSTEIRRSFSPSMFDRFNTLPLISSHTHKSLAKWSKRSPLHSDLWAFNQADVPHKLSPSKPSSFLLRLLSCGWCRDGVWRMALLGQKRDKELQRTQTFPTVSLHDMGCVLSVIRLHWFRRNFAWLHLSLPGCGELIDASGDHKCQSLSSMLRTVGSLSRVNDARLWFWPIAQYSLSKV